MARQTRKRILDASLAMFNAQGEPNVTTNHIADELEISPATCTTPLPQQGRHHRAAVRRVRSSASTPPSPRRKDACPGSRTWLQLHLVFECIWDYRFLYRDLIDILSRNRRLRICFARILKRADDRAHLVMRGLTQAGDARPAAELDAAATNILVIATFWLNYARCARRTSTSRSATASCR